MGEYGRVVAGARVHIYLYKHHGGTEWKLVISYHPSPTHVQPRPNLRSAQVKPKLEPYPLNENFIKCLILIQHKIGGKSIKN